jgi:hypothetical protein
MSAAIISNMLGHREYSPPSALTYASINEDPAGAIGVNSSLLQCNDAITTTRSVNANKKIEMGRRNSSVSQKYWDIEMLLVRVSSAPIRVPCSAPAFFRELKKALPKIGELFVVLLKFFQVYATEKSAT